MAALQFFTVNAHLDAVLDGVSDPAVEHLTGFMDFIPRVSAGGIVWGPSLDTPAGLVLRPIRGEFGSDGVLHRSVGVDEVQTVTITGSPTGGNFTLTFSGQTTGNIAYNATATQVQTALAALSTVGAGNVEVAGSAGGPWTVTFKGDLAFLNVAQMTSNSAGLTGGSTPTAGVATTTGGAAPAAGVELVAPTASLPLTKLIYDVVPSDIKLGGTDLYIAPFAFSAPTTGGATVNLASVTRIPALPGLKPIA